VIIALPVQSPDQINTVVVLDIEKNPIIFDSPVIEVSDDIFIDHMSVTLSKNEDLSEVYYTTDGSVPTLSSMKFSGPFSVTTTTTVTAACFRNGERVSEPSVKTLIKVDPLVGRTLPQSKPGLLFNLYSGEWNKMPDFNGITPKLTGVASDFSLANSSTEENFAIDYQGFIKIDKEGVYTFYLSSDDGSKMYLGDDLAIDHDGLHGSTVKNAAFALSPGLHSFRISFFEKTGGNALELKWKTGNSTPVPVPAEAFFHYK
jgi:alpha-L-fucosidase